MFLTVRGVAERLNISRSCVYELIAGGKLRCHRIGTGRGAIRVSVDDLNEYLAGCCMEKKTGEKPKTTSRLKLKHLRL